MLELAKDYYLINFKQILDFVFEQYEDLLNSQELTFYHQFNALDKASQMLLVRMTLRKGVFFRSDKLVYEEIPNLKRAAEALESTGLIKRQPSLGSETAAQWLKLLTKQQWVKVISIMKQQWEKKHDVFSAQIPPSAASLASLKSLKRSELDAVVLELHQLAPKLFEQSFYRASNVEVYQLLAFEAYLTFTLLYFGNSYQDHTEFVLSDLGLYRYEKYVIDKQTRLFESRRQIDAHLQFADLMENFEQVLSSDAAIISEFAQKLPQPQPTDTTLIRRTSRTKIQLARQLERLGDLQAALCLYASCKRHPARERMARIYAKNEQISDCIALCDQIIKAPFVEEELIFAREFSTRISKKYKLPFEKCAPHAPTESTILLKRDDNSFASVEQLAALYFSQQGDAFFVENQLFNSLFHLVFWCVIYAPVRGAFTHPFQIRPHDLYEADFLKLRQNEFNKALQVLKDKNALRKHCLELIKAKKGVTSFHLNWEILDSDLLSIAIERIPLEDLKNIFDRMWQDLRHHRAGFPDLIFFPDSGSYQLIEIKAPGDRLQKNQIRWMQYFSEHQIPHSVTHVEWADNQL